MPTKKRRHNRIELTVPDLDFTIVDNEIEGYIKKRKAA